MSTIDIADSRLEELWNSRPDSIEELQSIFVDLINGIDEEEVGEAFVVLRKAIEQFKPEESHNGIDGFKPYFYFRLKHHLSDSRRNERAKSDYMGAVSHFKKRLAFERKDSQHFAETGEHLREDDYFSDNKNYNVRGYMSRLDASIGLDDDSGTLGDTVGEEDNSFDENQFLEIFDGEERDLIVHIVAGTPIADLAMEYYGNRNNYNHQNKIRAKIFDLYNKVFNYYEGDTNFKTFFENVRSDIYSGDGIRVGGGAKITTKDFRETVDRDAGKRPCRVCGKKFKPVHRDHKDCSLECARSRNCIPKKVSKEDFVSRLRDKTWGEVAFEYDRTTERIREWAWYFGIRNRKDIGAKNWQSRYPHSLEGLPPREEVSKAIETMAFSEMQEKWGVNSEKVIRKWCSWYGLLEKLDNRPNRVLSKSYKKNLKKRTKSLGRSNARIRKSRIARGWDPEVPKDPSAEELLSVLTSMPWSEMADHFQLSERKLMDLAKKYKIKHLRPRMIFSIDGAKNSAKGLKESYVRGRKIPTKEELASDISSMTWDEMVDKWEWSSQWLKEKAKEYGVYDQKAKTVAAQDRITDKKHPMPSKEEFARMLINERIYKLRRSLHRNESTIRRKAVEMGLRHLLEIHHRPTKRDLREKLKRFTRQQILDFYLIRPEILDECLEEYQLDPNDYQDSVDEHQKKLKAEEKIKNQRRLALRADAPPAEEVEKILLSPGISSMKAAELMGLNLKTAIKHTERVGLGHLWPTRRASRQIVPVAYGNEHLKKENKRAKKICPPVDDLRDALKTGGIQEAMKRFDLGYQTAYRFARDCGLTKDGEPNTLLMAKELTKEEIEAAMPGQNHTKLAEQFGVTKENIKTRIRHLGIDTALYNKPPFDVDLFKKMLETSSWQEIADAVGLTYHTAIYWAEKLNLKHKKCMVVRPETCSANAKARHDKRYAELLKTLDVEQLRQDVQTMRFERVCKKYRVGRDRLTAMCEEFGIERPTKNSLMERSDYRRKQQETWSKKNNWPTKEEIEPLLREGKNYSQIARELNRTQYLIRKICIRYGIDHLCSSKRTANDPSRDEIQSCLDEGLSFKDAVSKLKTSRDRLKAACKKFDLPEPRNKKKPKTHAQSVRYASVRKDEIVSPVYRWQMSTTFSPIRLVPVWSVGEMESKSVLKLPDESEVAICS